MREKRSQEKGSEGVDIIRLVDNGGWGLHRDRGKEVMQNPALVIRSMRSEYIPNMCGLAIKIHFQGSGRAKPRGRAGRGKKGQKTVSEKHTQNFT